MPDQTIPTVPGPPTRRPRRLGRATLALVTAGGLAVGGVGIAHAATNSPAPTSTTGSTSRGAATPGSPGAPGAPGADGRPGGPAGGRQGHHHGPRGPHGDSATDLGGRITAVTASKLTVTDEFGRARSYTLTSSTRVHQGREQLQASALRTGERVHVRGKATSGSSGTLTAVNVHVLHAHLGGVVTAVGNNSVTITDRDGFTRRISTSADTQYLQDRQSASADAVHSGSVVHAEGTVDGDGTTLDAGSINVRTAPPTRDAGKAPGHRGHGQSPQGGASGAPSTGTPSTDTTPSVSGT